MVRLTHGLMFTIFGFYTRMQSMTRFVACFKGNQRFKLSADCDPSPGMSRYSWRKVTEVALPPSPVGTRPVYTYVAPLCPNPPGHAIAVLLSPPLPPRPTRPAGVPGESSPRESALLHLVVWRCRPSPAPFKVLASLSTERVHHGQTFRRAGLFVVDYRQVRC